MIYESFMSSRAKWSESETESRDLSVGLLCCFRSLHSASVGMTLFIGISKLFI